MHRERLELLQGLGNITSGVVPTFGFSTQRIHEIEVQLPQLLQRHKMIHNAVLANSAPIATISLLTFLVGTGVLLVGVIITTLELSRSQREVAYEIQDGLRLRKEDLQ